LKVLSFLLASLFLLTSCKYGTSDGVKEPYKKLLSHLEDTYEKSQNTEDKFRLEKAQNIQKLA
jgi:hypothetical protein